MTVKEALDKGTQFLQQKGIESARFDTELLLSHVLGLARLQLYLEFERPLLENEIKTSRELLVRRGTGYPAAYIVGSRGFYKEDFIVRPGVLIPRPETELLVELALEFGPRDGTLYDFGAGSGCVGLSIIKEVTGLKLVGIESSFEAAKVARENAEKLGLTDRTTIVEGSVEDYAFEEPATLIVANPPYIDEKDPAVESGVREFEPHQALFSSEKGFGHIKSWAKLASQNLSSGQPYIFELGYQQAEDMKPFLESIFTQVTVKKDLSGHLRAFLCFL